MWQGPGRARRPALVMYGPYGGQVQASRVGQVPVEVALAGEDGACVAAAHGDDDVERLADSGRELDVLLTR
jgi:hypothetical protein